MLRLATMVPGLTFDESSVHLGTEKPLERSARQFLARGYFQNYQFVDVVKDELLNRFKNSKIFDSAFGTQKHQIAVHVRFGDIAQTLQIWQYMGL